jgi:hypothetical protein
MVKLFELRRAYTLNTWIAFSFFLSSCSLASKHVEDLSKSETLMVADSVSPGGPRYGWVLQWEADQFLLLRPIIDSQGRESVQKMLCKCVEYGFVDG